MVESTFPDAVSIQRQARLQAIEAELKRLRQKQDQLEARFADQEQRCKVLLGRRASFWK